MEAAGVTPAGDQPLELARRGQLGVRQQDPDVQCRARFELDPADPPAVHEHRRQAEPATVLLHHLGGRTHVRVEAGPEMSELGLEGGGGDQPVVAAGEQTTSGVPGGVVGTGFGQDRVERAAAEDRPHPAAEQTEHQREHHQHHQSDSRGDHDLIDEIGLVGVADGDAPADCVPRWSSTQGVTATRNKKATTKGTSSHQAKRPRRR